MNPTELQLEDVYKIVGALHVDNILLRKQVEDLKKQLVIATTVKTEPTNA